METLNKIKSLTEGLTTDVAKSYKGNYSAGTRARKTCQDIKSLLDTLRKEIIEIRKNDNNA